MNISGSAIHAGIAGINAGQAKANQAAQEIASVATTKPAQEGQAVAAVASKAPDLEQSLIELRRAEIDVRANSRVIETADEVLGTLINTRA